MKKSNGKRNNRKEKDEPFFTDDGYNEPDETVSDKFEVDDEEIQDEADRIAKNHRKQKLVSVFELIGKPSKFSAALADAACSPGLLSELIILLEKKGVMIHFNNEYPAEEKCRFIIEEIFKQGVDNSGNGSHINFIYEDFHPEKIIDDEEPGIAEEF